MVVHYIVFYTWLSTTRALKPDAKVRNLMVQKIFFKNYCQSKKTFYLCASFLKPVFIDE